MSNRSHLIVNNEVHLGSLPGLDNRTSRVESPDSVTRLNKGEDNRGSPVVPERTGELIYF